MSAKKPVKKAAKKAPKKVAATKKAKGKPVPKTKGAKSKPKSPRSNSSGHRARKKNVEPPKLPGRPSDFDPVIFREICVRLSKGEPLTIICKEERMPCDDTVRNWGDADEEVGKELRRARDRGFDSIAYEIIEIADNKGHEDQDTIATDFGPIPNKEWILRSKLRCEMRLKLLSKWDPRRYGDKVTTELTGPGGKPVEVHQTGELELSTDQLERIKQARALGAALVPPAALADMDPAPENETEDG